LGEALWFSQVALPTLGWVEIFCILPKNHWDGRVIFRMAEKIVGNGGRESSPTIPNVGCAARETQNAIPAKPKLPFPILGMVSEILRSYNSVDYKY